MPIRSWAAESMGFPAQIEQGLSSTSGKVHAVAMSSHCAQMMGETVSHQDSIGHHSGVAFTNVCDLCMAFAFTQPQKLVTITSNAQSYQIIPTSILVSADLALTNKPPTL